MQTRFWWIRHGPVPGPRQLKGQRDVPCDLSDTPRIQALAARLPEDLVVLSSPLSRALETGRAVTRRDPDRLEPALMEQDFGDWTGRYWDDLGEETQAIGFWDAPATTRTPNGESFADQCARVQALIERLAREFDGRDVACFCHAGTTRAALAVALGCAEDPAPAQGFVIDPLSLTRVDALEGGYRIESVNERFPP